MTIMWLIVIVLLLLVELMTFKLLTTWFIISGLIALIISLFVDNFLIQFIVFLIVGILLFITIRPIFKKKLVVYKNK